MNKMSNNTFTTVEATFLVASCSLIAAFASGLVWYATGFKDGVRQLEKDAVMQGYAQYATDSEGNPQWQWIRSEKTITGGLKKETE